MEVLYIDSVRLNLSLQAEGLAFIVNMSVLTMFILHKVCRIELYAWTTKRHHLDSGFF